MKANKSKRLRRGRDWHGWAFYDPGDDGIGMCHWAEVEKPTGKKPTSTGRWIRVKFVPAKS